MTKPSVEKKWLQYYRPEEIQASQFSGLTMYQYYKQMNDEYRDRPALIYRDRLVLHGELLEEIPLYARGMLANGAKKGDTISICSNSTPEYIKLFFAANYLGVAVNCADLRMPEADFINLLSETKSIALFISLSAYKKYQDQLHDIMDNIILLPDDSSPSQMSRTLGQTPKGTKSFGAFLSQCYKINPVDPHPFEENLIALIEQTGGSTGKPKSVLMTNENMSALPDSILSRIPKEARSAIFESGIKSLSIMPPYTAGGMFALLSALLVGLTYILVDDYSPSLYPEYIMSYRPESLITSPIIIEQMMNSDLLKEADLSFVHQVSSAGDLLTPNMEAAFIQFLRDRGSQAKISVSYGMTESSTTGTTRILSDPEPGSVGVPNLNVELGIFDPESLEELGYGVEGEICLGGPGIMAGYLNQPQETAQTIRKHSDGRTWLHTGDIGFINSRAEVFVVDRLKNMFKYHGVHIYPTEIDKVLEKHPLVLQAKTIGKNQSGHGHLPYSFVVLKKGSSLSSIKEELISACQADFPIEAVPRDIFVLDQMPRTRMNKVNISKLRDLLEDRI